MIGLSVFLAASASEQPAGRCRFDPVKLQFQGEAAEQASCLLRHVSKWGKVDAEPATLPPALADFVGKPTGPF